MRIQIACAGLLIATAPSLRSQQSSAAPVGNATTSLQSAKHDFRFEVASIRPAETPNGHNSNFSRHSEPDRFTAEQTTIASLAVRAFKIKQSFEMTCPHWMDSAYFTVNATFPEGATRADLPIMIQHLLEDRFSLVFHHETRQMSGYRLVVAKSGPRLTKSAPLPAEQAPVKEPSIEVKNGVPQLTKGSGIEFKNGIPQFAKDGGSGEIWGPGPSVMRRGRNETMERLAGDLSDKVDALVVDATGLTGGYDYILTYTAEPTTARGGILGPSPTGGTPVPAAGAELPADHPLLREALLEQLGLKLEPVKNVTLDVIVIDSANKQPTEN
jgi:uncharacterized protein (TIGR03435 family)